MASQDHRKTGRLKCIRGGQVPSVVSFASEMNASPARHASLRRPRACFTVSIRASPTWNISTFLSICVAGFLRHFVENFSVAQLNDPSIPGCIQILTARTDYSHSTGGFVDQMGSPSDQILLVPDMLISAGRWL